MEQQVTLDEDFETNDAVILKERFVTADTTEVQGESLSDFMTHLQQLASHAFAKEPGCPDKEEGGLAFSQWIR